MIRNTLVLAFAALTAAACSSGGIKTGARDIANRTAQDTVSAATSSATSSVEGAASSAVPTSLQQMAPSSSYPLTTCLVTDEPLVGPGIAYSYGGREVRFCCPGCATTFMKSPDTYLAKLALPR